MGYKVFVVSDLQVPFHDVKFVNAMAEAIESFMLPGIDRVATIGDEMDMQTISKWAIGTEKEWERSIGRDRDATVQVLRDLMVTDMIRSNHTDRLFNRIRQGAPGFLGLPELQLENFLRLPELGITFHREGMRVGKGWMLLHGDEAGTSQIAGSTAAGLVKKTGLNIACGHTHRLGMQPFTTAINGRITRTLYGVEVGNAMNMRLATYAKTHNWQQGWAVLHVKDNGQVIPELIPVIDKSFMIMGERYSW